MAQVKLLPKAEWNQEVLQQLKILQKKIFWSLFSDVGR